MVGGGTTEERTAWLARVASIRRHVKDGERAPHKPLLLLYALGRFRADGTTSTRYADAEPALGRLLEEYGPPRRTSAAYPFRRLANDDGLWVVTTPSGEDPGDNASRLRSLDATGRLDDGLVEALRADPGLVVVLSRFVLEDNWPPSLHDELAAQVGLDLDHAEADLVRDRLTEDRRPRRDPAFRERVLVAYEYRCAVCRYDGRLDNTAVALEAAHLRWWSEAGPDTVDNGVCLCSIHHVLLDKGVIGITPEHEVQVSKHFVGHSEGARQLVLAHAGAPLLEPQPGEPAPADDHVRWHADQVFRSPARAAPSGG